MANSYEKMQYKFNEIDQKKCMQPNTVAETLTYKSEFSNFPMLIFSKLYITLLQILMSICIFVAIEIRNTLI